MSADAWPSLTIEAVISACLEVVGRREVEAQPAGLWVASELSTHPYVKDTGPLTRPIDGPDRRDHLLRAGKPLRNPHRKRRPVALQPSSSSNRDAP